MNSIGVIGGSGLYEMDNLSDIEHIEVDTPWGAPSDKLIKGKINDIKVIFLSRHGKGHKIKPSDINFRANIYALKSLGVDRIISVSAVGSMKEEIEPGHLVIPDQFIDFTKNRVSSFFEPGFVAHVSMAHPICGDLSDQIYKSCINSGATVHKDGTYICIEGPQFSSKAESELFRSWNVDIIGMTNMPEAKLAREAEICYSTLALSTDYDCWHEDHDHVTVEDIIEIMNKNVAMAKKVLSDLFNNLSEEMQCNCRESLKNAIITSKDSINENVKTKLGPIIERYI